MGRSHVCLHRTRIHLYNRDICRQYHCHCCYHCRNIDVLQTTGFDRTSWYPLTHLHPFPASYPSVVVSDQVVVHRATYVHKTSVERDHLRFGILLGSTRRLGFIIESIQFLIVLESMFQKLPEANFIDCNFSSCVGIQCVSRCVHLCIYVLLFSFFLAQWLLSILSTD